MDNSGRRKKSRNQANKVMKMGKSGRVEKKKIGKKRTMAMKRLSEKNKERETSKAKRNALSFK